MKFFVGFFLLLLFWETIFTDGAELEERNECYGKKCPVGTYFCKRHMYITDDKKFLQTDTSCLDKKQNELDTVTEKAENPFDSNFLDLESLSFSGVYTIRNNQEEGQTVPDTQ